MTNSFPGRLLAVALASVLLAGCGGGGSDAPPGPPPSARFGASSSYEGNCTIDGQKHFVRAYMDEVYLWYNEIPEVDASKYDNIPDYFSALVVRTPDANGQPKDRFSTVLPTSAISALLSQSFVPPSAAGVETALSLSAAVPQVRVVNSAAGHKVGYVQFNDFSQGAQDEMILAMAQLRDAGVQDLVLDLRFNSGGFLYIAQSTASMIAPPGNAGKVFEQLNYNDKRGAETQASRLLFLNILQTAETRFASGTELPNLNLSRAYVLTSGQTCSASESVINSLRGIDMEVVLVGGNTCGKPYGFHQKNNCGYAYFPLEFQGTNNKGFGNYTAGFSPTCTVADNRRVAPGSASDPLLNAALYHVDKGACPAVPAQSAAAPLLQLEQPARPAWAGRLLR